MSRPLWRRALVPLFLALLLLNVGVLLAWTLPRSLRQRNAAAGAVAARGELEFARERVRALRERAAAIRANRADLERFYTKLAGGEQDLVPTLEEIEQLAREPGLQPTTRGIKREALEDAPLERIEVTLPLEGSYAQLVDFLRGVERSSRFLTVDGIALRADAQSGGALQVQLSTYLRQTAAARVRRRRGR
jgi:Tfp pilus assembly protein PilO